MIIRVFIPATTANDLRLWRISIPDIIHYIILNSWERASNFWELLKGKSKLNWKAKVNYLSTAESFFTGGAHMFVKFLSQLSHKYRDNKCM